MIKIYKSAANKDVFVTAKELIKGDPGGHYTPVVDENGVLRWVASMDGMASVKDANIRGPQGVRGASGVHVGAEEPTDPDATVWIDLDGGGIELEAAEGGSY